jgi:Fe-S-cluster containining protein
MIIIGQTLVSEDLFEKQFVCDLNACKGACCIEGESGAPLEKEELLLIEEQLEAVRPYMRKEGLEVLDREGHYTVDSDGDFVTTLVGNHGECVFVNFDDKGIAKCALEQAFLDGKTAWKKPISCHLYPVRLAKLTEYVAVNYHRWQVCEPACACGKSLQVPVYRFLKEPLIRQFGEAWYAELEEVAEQWYSTR